jgi:3-phosphoshikimate 1-carboxyvinyltransferase
MAALAALAVGLPFPTVLAGDATTMRDVMAPIAKVLRHRGARIEGHLVSPKSAEAKGRVGILEPPFELGPSDVPLSPLAFDLAEVESWVGARPLVKAAALLSGLRAEGTTQLYERELGDDTVPGLLASAEVPLRSLGPLTELDGPIVPAGVEGELPVEPSAAVAVLAVALQPGGETVGIRRAPTRRTASGWLEALTDAGASIDVQAKRDALGQAAADVTLRGPLVRGLELGGAHRVGVATAVLLALAARAPEGSTSRLTDLEDLDDAHRNLLESFGISRHPIEGGLAVAGLGLRRARAVSLDLKGRADLTLGALVLALGADGPSVLEGADALVARYPRLLATLRGLGATIDVVA